MSPSEAGFPGDWPGGWEGAAAVFFDCDSTLSSLEGIDELGRRRGVDVAGITAAAMDGATPLEEVYRTRLEQVRPSAGDMEWLAARYAETAAPGAAEVVGALESVGIACHVLSGGLLPAVQAFARELGFRADRVHAVPLDPDDPRGAERAARHPLARSGGKPEVIEGLCGAAVPRGRRLLVGDGASDLEAAGAVGLFVAAAGFVHRPAVVAAAGAAILVPDLAPVAALACSPAQWQDLAGRAPRLAGRAAALRADPASFRLP